MRKFIIPVFLILSILITGCSVKTEEPVTADIFAMDTYMNITVWCKDGKSAVSKAEQRIREIESELSVTNPESDISRINNSDGTSVSISADTQKILSYAKEMGDESNGALDISIYPILKAWGFTTQNYRIPNDTEIQVLLKNVDYTALDIHERTATLPKGMQIDTGALTKGYTGDVLMDLFRSCGAKSAIVNLGGNVQTLGTKPDGSLWNIAIANPFAPYDNLGIIKTSDKAVITSGNYERYFIGEDGNAYWHILDTETGKPANNGFVSVTVVSGNGLRCDSLSTALFAEGIEKAIDHWKISGDFDMICVTEEPKILITNGIAENFTNLTEIPLEVLSLE